MADLERPIGEVEARGLEIAVRFGIPHGPGAELTNPGPQRIALYELTRPAAAEKLADRRDFWQPKWPAPERTTWLHRRHLVMFAAVGSARLGRDAFA